MKTAVLESLFNKVAVLKTCNLIQKRLQHRCFSVNIAKSLKKTILKNICKRLLLYETGKKWSWNKPVLKCGVSQESLSNYLDQIMFTDARRCKQKSKCLINPIYIIYIYIYIYNICIYIYVYIIYLYNIIYIYII